MQSNEVLGANEIEDRGQIDVPTSPTDDDTEVEIITERAPDRESEDASHFSAHMPNSNFLQPNQFNQMNIANGINGMDQIQGMNGILPMDFASMMAAANSMMPMAGISNMMGLGMVPAMTQMFGGFDNSNMSMNGMNIGGMDNYQNQFNGGGNESWMNNNQGNFGNSAYMNGNFGGYSGYNNYNQMNEQAYANNDFYRGYGRQGFANRRGRRGYYNGGGFGRGGFNQGNNHYNHANQEQLYPQQGDQNISGNAGPDEFKTAASTQNHDEALQASFAPGGEHDFDEELGRPRLDAGQESFEQTSSNSMGVILKTAEPTKLPEDVANEARPDRDTHASGILNEPEKPAPEQVSEDTATTSNDLHPIQAFVSDEPQSQSTPLVDSNIPSGPASRSNIRAPLALGPGSVNSPTEPRGVGVVGAPTGPRALREGLPNTGRSGFRYGQVSKPIVASPVVSEHPQNSVVTESKHDTLSILSRNKSLSPERRPLTHRRSRPDDSNSPSREVEQNGYSEKHRERSRKYSEHQADHDSERPSRSSRHKHGDYSEDEDNSRRSKHRSRRHKDEDTDTDDREQRSTKRSHRSREDYEDNHHHHSSKRTRRHHDEDTSASSRKHHHDRSRSPEHRNSDKDRHNRRKEPQEEYSSRKHSRDDTEATPASIRDSEYPEEHPSSAYSKRRSSTYEAAEDSHHESKRSKHEHTLSRRSTTNSARDSSKPSTPLTASFPATKSATHRASNASNEPPRSTLLKQIPTGPRGGLPIGTTSRDCNQPQVRSLSEVKLTPTSTSNGKDPHTLEREARDRERLQREMQRRAFMDVNGGLASKRKGPSMASARRVTYRFEDEGGLDVRRGEREREAGRW